MEYAAFNSNRQPTKALSMKTPISSLFRSESTVDYSAAKVRGCDAYILNPTPGKFQVKAKKGFFAGYGAMSSTYIIV